MKAQSAIEFLTTYGWAIIILVVVLAFIVFLLSSLNSAVPNTCIFNSGFSCSDFLIESNSISTSVLLLLSNTAKYPIESATVSANISTLGQIVAHCSPGYILPGGDLICIGTTSNTLKNNINLNGVATINATECTDLTDPELCTQKYNINYTATLDTKTTTYSPNICSISLNPEFGLITNTQYSLSATVNLNNNPISGATVNFTSNSMNLVLSPSYENTASNGTATTLFYSKTEGTYYVKASFYTCSTTSAYSFSKKTTTENLKFVPITLTNNQNIKTLPNFQQKISFNPKLYGSYENSNLSNIEFTADEPYGVAGSTPLYSWIESGASSTASEALVWVNLGSVILNQAQSYISVNVINLQSTATGTDFQQMIYFNPSSYSSYEASDLGNIRFYNGNNELYSWCESGCTSTSSNAVFWINTGSLNIGPNSYATVNMTFEPTSTEYDGVYAGEAPQLSSSYAEYDNGANVFTKYENFAGTTLWSGISTISGASITQNNGLEIGINSIDTGYSIMTNWDIISPFVYESLITAQNGAGATNFQEGLIADASSDTSQGLDGGTCAQSWYITRRDIPNNFYELISCPLTTLAQSGASGTYPYTSMETFTQNTIGVSAYDDGTTLSNTISDQYQSGYVGYDVVFSSSINPNSIFIQYSRVRSYPPNGVMPTFQLGGINTKAFTQIPTTIYLNFLPNNSPVTSGYTGYAPQLYCTSGCMQSSYAEYDNGGKIFNFYDNFAGSALDSGWTTSTSTSYSPTVVVSNGVTFTPNDLQSGGASLYTTSDFLPSGNTLDFYGYIGAQKTGGYSEQGFGFGPWPSASDTGWVNQGIASLSGTSNFYIGGPDFYSSSERENTFILTDSGLGVWTISIFPNNMITYYNYINSGSIQEPITTSEYSLGIAAQALSGYPDNPSFIQWFRMRQTPPNGVMPTYTIGSVSS